MSNISDLQELVAAWADQIVPERTAMSTIAKLLEEIGELIASERMNDPEELADVAILVLDLFHIQGVNLEMAVKQKMLINSSRHWEVADNGAARHT